MSQYVRPGTPAPGGIPGVNEISPPGVNLVVVEGALTQIVAYHHLQNTPSNIWTITHNLDFYPNVTAVDSGGSICEGEIAYTNKNSLVITFTSAFSGQAYLS
jgi:hypothetical protein